MNEQSAIPKQILVVYQEDEISPSDGSKGIFAPARNQLARVAPLNLTEFSNNLQNLCSQLGDVFERITPQFRAYDLESVELTVDVTAKGEVKFIGSVGTELKGGLKLSFRRTQT